MRRPRVDGTHLRALRQEGLLRPTVAEAAKAAGIPEETVLRIESRRLGEVALRDVVAYMVRGTGIGADEALRALSYAVQVDVPGFDLDEENRRQGEILQTHPERW